MASSKSALKAVKSAIDNGNFVEASAQAAEILKADAKNYNALIFLGFAEEKLNHYDEAEKALQKASEIKPQDVQPLKGLITLYEHQGGAKLAQYHRTVLQLATIYAQLDEREQCQIVVDRYESFVKKHGTRAEYRRGLELVLPSSPLYGALEGRVPHPAHTYTRILESTQAEEQEWITGQIAERRTRLGARLDKVTAEVKYEANANFDVEQKYQDVLDWVQDDDVRHTLDQELLQRMVDNLLAMPPDRKPHQRDRVLDKANGMVIIKQPFNLAWNIALEWVDAESLSDWEPSILYQYIEIFPDAGLAKISRGMLYGQHSPFPKPQPAAGEDEVVLLSEADQLILMNEGLEDARDSMLAQRIVAYTYLAMSEYESAVTTARSAEKLYHQAEKDYALSLQDSLDAVNLILGRSMVIYQSPRHHPEARSLFEDILARKPLLTDALLGIGLIYEEDQDYPNAVKFLSKASERDPTNLRINLEFAWCRARDCDLEGGLDLLRALLAQLDSQDLPDPLMKSEVLYRIAYCKWEIDASPQARKDKTGPYKYLIESLKVNPSYAPAYTLLGFYFQDYARNKSRARVAFQKAFELSTSELSAAEQLARAFANTAEWDLVELVAQRVVDSGKARAAPGSKRRSFSWPYAALGVVQMSRSQYSLSIVSFQQALRISPNDYHSWVGLGESYHNSGRYVAASRAFNKAESIDHGLSPEEAWFAKYMLANVERELGNFDEAVRAYRSVLEIKPGEQGVLLSLLQTTVDFAWTQVHQGHFGHAAQLATTAIEIAASIVQENAAIFNLWKAVGDACSVLNASRAFAVGYDLKQLKELLGGHAAQEMFAVLRDTDQIGMEDIPDAYSLDTPESFTYAAVLAHKRGVHVNSEDMHAQAVSWYNLGWAEHDTYMLVSGKHVKQPRHLLKAAVRCFKRAIELEASNSEFWNALGIVTMTLNPRVSQHSFIRSLHLNEHSARAWTNLGVLYLVNNESELANQAFTKAQSTDPEYAAAWIGQGLLATLYGSMDEARGLFKHAFEISESSSIPAKQYYATTAFDHLSSSIVGGEIGQVLLPLFALRQLHSQQPSDVVTKHLLSLLSERVDEFDVAQRRLTEVCAIAEAQYEQSESEDSLARFAQAKADYARQALAQNKNEDALESAQLALDLSDDVVSPAYTKARHRWRLSAQITAALALSSTGKTADAFHMVQAAMDTTKELGNGQTDPAATCLLAQILWAAGSDDEKEAARAQLFECIEQNPTHIGAAILLAVVSLLDDDDESLDVASDDLKSMRSLGGVSATDKLRIAQVLSGVMACRASTSASGEDAVHDAQNEIMMSPHQPQGWLELAQGSHSEYASEMAVKNALKQMPPNGDLRSEDLARTFAITGRREDLAQATMLAPWLTLDL